MKKTKLEFKNAEGETLAGLLELPEHLGEVKTFALFAHCFTCGKDVAAASRISRALAAKGIAVLRFDFTGLGNSDGDFSNTNFSSNIEDLVRAAMALEEQYGAPQILIGHSLGGAAVLGVAAKLNSVRAVVTIGAPATTQHVGHLFAGKIGEI
jgi:pimeloyl-ACP methyl ester carboxylesterase